jgi:hypothetical protein
MKKISALILLFALAFNGIAQSRFEEEGEETDTKTTEQSDPEAKPSNARPAPRQSNFWNRTRFGGNVGLQFGNPTFINLSPRVYYLPTEKLWLGVGVTYMYTQWKAPYVPFETSTYGANISVTYQVFNPLFLQAEYEPLNFESFNRFEGTYERIWVHGLLIGGGISQPVGRGAVFFSALYNVTWKDADRSFYGSPWVIRIGAGF